MKRCGSCVLALSRSGKANTAEAALEHALIARYSTLGRVSRVIGDWFGFYNQRHPHQALNMKTPAEAFALSGLSEQIPLGHYIRGAPSGTGQ